MVRVRAYAIDATVNSNNYRGCCNNNNNNVIIVVVMFYEHDGFPTRDDATTSDANKSSLRNLWRRTARDTCSHRVTIRHNGQRVH